MNLPGTRAVSAACVGALLAALAGCEGRRRSTTLAGESSQEKRAGPYVALVDLSRGVPERASAGWLGLSTPPTTLESVGHVLEQVGRDRDVRGVLVSIGSLDPGLARSAELGAMLAALAAKVPVWCHADNLDNRSLYFVARACSRVWLSPAGGVDAVGLAAQSLYFHKLLAEELGLDVDFLQVGKFKGAEEPFTRDGPSPEARESLTSTLADLRDGWLAALRTGRAHAADSAFEDGPYSAKEAKARGVVDDVGYLDEARKALVAASGAGRASLKIGPGAAKGDDWVDGLRALAGDALGPAPVVVVPATGAITMEEGGLLGGSGGIVERKLSRVLLRLEKDDDVKAVVLRIDSPGGSALASDLLWHRLMRIRAKKVLVVSVGEMAASGGYYLASSGSVVFADDASIVGSIGVVGGKVALNAALERVGVHAETFAAKPGNGAAARAAAESLLMPWDDPTRARIFATMSEIYSLFLDRVAEGRGIPVARVAESAEGRIFSGRQGKARGLVDEIGGLREAIVRARSLAHLPSDAQVDVEAETPRWLNAVGLSDPEDMSPYRSSGAQQVGSGPLGALAPDAVPFIESLSPLAVGERALCAVPFMLTVR